MNGDFLAMWILMWYYTVNNLYECQRSGRDTAGLFHVERPPIISRNLFLKDMNPIRDKRQR